MKTLASVLSVFATALLLSACGGGGGSGVADGCPAGHTCITITGPVKPPTCRVAWQTDVPRDSPECAELTRTPGSDIIDYGAADKRNLRGHGVVIGVSDNYKIRWTLSNGRTVTHPDLPSFRVLDNEPVQSLSELTQSDSLNFFHGVGVLGVLAAQINGEYVRGIAPGASYLYAGHRNAPSAELLLKMISEGAEIINLSHGSGSTHDWTIRNSQGEVDVDATRESFRNDLSHTTEASREFRYQSATRAEDRTILVYAAGNTRADTMPDTPASYPLFDEDLRGHMLAVVGVGLAAEIATNPCGRDGASYCLAAPTGHGQNWLYPPDGYAISGGSSTAAPLVTGALALMKEYFRRMCNNPGGAGCGLGSHELVARIKDTADKSGIYADESVYGAGLLDLGNALSAQGTLMMRMGESLAGSRGFVLAESGLAAGGAFGDAMRLALRGQTLAAFDKYNAPFPVMSDAVLTEAVDDGRELGEVLRARQAGEVAPALAGLEWDDGAGWFSLNAPGDANFGTDSGFRRKGSNFLSGKSRNPYAALAGNGIVAGGALRLNNNGTFRAAMFGENIRDETRTRGALMEWSVTPVGGCASDRNLSPPQSFSRKVGHREGSLTGLDRSGRGCNLRPAQWSFQLGAVEELDGMLRSSGSGVFGALRARTTFAGIHWRSPGMFNNWQMRIAAHAGRTSSGSGTWLSATERLWSGAYALGLERGNVLSVGDSLGFRLRQPLRTEGGFRMRVPTGRTKYGELTWREVSGEPSGRELELEARYGRRLFGGSWWVSAGVVEDPGHDASAKTEGRGLVGFERAF